MKALFLGTLAASQATPIINSSLPTERMEHFLPQQVTDADPLEIRPFGCGFALLGQYHVAVASIESRSWLGYAPFFEQRKSSPARSVEALAQFLVLATI